MYSASGQAHQKHYLTMRDDLPEDMGFKSEPIRAQADVNSEESGVVSDDAGFFSGEDVYNSSEDVVVEDDIEEEEEEEQFDATDHRDLDYFFSEDFAKLDEIRIFSINFDRLIELMRKAARMLDLFRGAKLVEAAIDILKMCVNYTERFVQDISCSYRRDARKNANRTAVQTNEASSSEIPVIRAVRSRKNLSDKLATTTDSQIVIDFDDIPIDVKSRRLHLQKKFNGLISNALLDFQFDLRSFYMHEHTINDHLPQENFDCGRIFKDLKSLSARENTASIIDFKLSNNDSGFDDYDELTGDSTSQTHQEALDSNDPTTATSCVTNEVNIERMETNQIEDETENQLPTAMENGQQIPAVATNKKKRKLRERDVKNLMFPLKRRKPLEALNAGDPEVIRDETDDHNFDPGVTLNELQAEVNQTELAGIAEGDVSLGYHSQSQFDQCSDVEDTSFNIRSDSGYQLNEDGERLRVPSPICGNEPATSHITFKSTVNMKKLTADIQETLLESDAAREDISIEELILQTNLNIKGVQDESVSNSSPEISLHDFLFASLHAAVNLRLFLEPVDNGSVFFTKTIPDD